MCQIRVRSAPRPPPIPLAVARRPLVRLKQGIWRPMDNAQTQVLFDFSGKREVQYLTGVPQSETSSHPDEDR